MIKELISIANLLDKKGFLREADELDLIINKLARTDEDLEFRDNKVPKHEGFIWPWDIWNNLSPAIRESVYDDLNSFGMIPILGMGSNSAEFLLKLFEGKYEESANSALIIILQFYLSSLPGKGIKIDLYKKTSMIKDIANYIRRILPLIATEISQDLIINGLAKFLKIVIEEFKKFKTESLKQVGDKLEVIVATLISELENPVKIQKAL